MYKKWLDAITKLGAIKNARVTCPECEQAILTRIDIPLEREHSVFERLIYCENCNAEKSFTIEGATRYFGYNGKDKVSDTIKIDVIKRRYQASKTIK
ncbi:hypothetical protein ACFODZ_17040 [Marinicella sediminis]|uniref:HNH endonuclease n=2 Tax=Marinicella sediminis TaxID=1792834 RepID=A0ABV7JGE3_9GAMM